MTHAAKCNLRILAIVSGLLCCPSILMAELLPAAPERLLSFPSDLESIEDFAAMPDGSYFLSYRRYVTDQSPDIVVQRMSSDGELLGAPIPLPTLAGTFQNRPRIAVTENGESLIAFSNNNVDGDPEGGAFARAFDAAGNPLGVEFHLNSQTQGYQGFVSAAYLGNNAFVLSWSAGTFPNGIRARRFDLFGNPLGAEFSVPAPPDSADYSSGYVASNGSGTYAMAWVESNSTGRTLHLGFFGADDTLLVERVLDSLPSSSSWEFAPRHVAVSANATIVHWTKGGYYYSYVVAVNNAGEMLSAPIQTSERLFGVSATGTMLAEPAKGGPHEDSAMAQHALTGEEIGQPRRLTDSLRPRSYSHRLTTSVNSWGSATVLYRTILDENYDFFFQGPEVVSTFLRRFCDSSDPTCDRCPGFDDATDNDADGIPDGCDPCTNTGGGPTAMSGRTFLSNAATVDAYPRRSNRFIVRAEIPLPAVSASLPDLPVVSGGMQIRVEAPSGSAMVDARLPAGTFAGKGTAGWTVKPGKLRFRDRSAAPLRGIRDLTIRDRSRAHPGYVRVDVAASGDRYGITERYLPMRTILAFGAQQDAMSGNCTEIQYDTNECTGAVAGYNTGSLECARPLGQ